ncbi:MAG TPA: hypothetical protein VKD23_06515, partial [Terriglobales bacterium]|nr:hypothetical protein [Terriglobales bacterium]
RHPLATFLPPLVFGARRNISNILRRRRDDVLINVVVCYGNPVRAVLPSWYLGTCVASARGMEDESKSQKPGPYIVFISEMTSN